jgi:hypothetical protein
MKKKQVCLMIAGLVSICFLICLISAIHAVVAAVEAGASLPTSAILATLVTAVCTVSIWKGVREMDD